VKTALKGNRFRDAEDIKKNETAELNVVLLEVFANCFQKLFKHFNKCIKVGEDCLSNDKTIFDFPVLFISFFSH
jgi:hypothetical protein